MRLSERTRTVLIALAFAVAAAIIVVLAVKKSGGKDEAKVPVGSVTVFVASVDIPANTPGSEFAGFVKTANVSKDAVVAGAISQLAQVQGQTSTAAIFKGEQITLLRFQAQQAEGVPGQITGNIRAVQVPGDANQLLVGALKAGDHVDVLANIKYRVIDFRPTGNETQAQSQSSQSDRVATRIVLRNILVLRDPAAPTSSGKFGSAAGYQVLLAVTDTQAQKLFYAMKNTDFALELRPGHGSSDSPESVETTGSMLSDGLRKPQFLQVLLGASGPK